MQAIWITLLSWTANPRVTINTWMQNYTSIANPTTYIQRNTQENSWVTWKHWNQPIIRIDIPAYQKADIYSWILTFTLYEN
jgi:hypothetical protein